MTKTTALTCSEMVQKLRSIFNTHKKMKAVSKMLTQEFELSNTESQNVMALTMNNGECQSVTIIDNRFAVIEYSKPKGAKSSTIFLNKSTPITSIKASKVVVVDLEKGTIENGDLFLGFSAESSNSVPMRFLLGSSLGLVAVRNYINHTQLYIATIDDKLMVADNIKAVREFINYEVAVVEDSLMEHKDEFVPMSLFTHSNELVSVVDRKNELVERSLANARRLAFSM